MKRKDILKFIARNSPVSFDTLFEELNKIARISRNKLSRILDTLLKSRKISFNEEENTFSVKESIKRRKKKGIRKETKKKDIIADATIDFYRITEKYRIRREFPLRVMKEAEALPRDIPAEEIKKRIDLREEMIFTIDGADAKDLDDAVSIKKVRGGWELGVHIADVSYYVPKNSNLDKEARKRGNSYYFINRVVPMFPFILSNQLCSLNPDEDKLTLSVLMNIDKSGEIKQYRILPSIIRSKYRLTYDFVQSYLDGKISIEDKALKNSLDEMNVLFRILYNKRIKEGSIDFNFKEQKLELDENDEPVKIWFKDRMDSERIIEEFMLAANRCIALFISKLDISLYRVHEEPENSKLMNFLRIALKLGHKIQGTPIPTPFDIQRILDEVKDKPYRELINHILLRSMQQARYLTDNLGHYGLGFEFYTHFTSPIRRYADLVVHQLVKHLLFSPNERLPYTKEELDKIAGHISKTERIAMEMEREFYKIKALRFLIGMEGKKMKGMVTGIVDFGMFVQLDKYGVEGLVRFSDMEEDYFVFDESNYLAIGKRTKKRFSIGDKVEVRIKRIDIMKGFLDLDLVKS